MGLDNTIYGAGGGFISGLFFTILTALGFRDRIHRLEEEKLDEKIFRQFEVDLDKRLERMENLLEKIYNGKDLKYY